MRTLYFTASLTEGLPVGGSQRAATAFASAGHTPRSAVADAAPRGFPGRQARVAQREARPAGVAPPPAERRG